MGAFRFELDGGRIADARIAFGGMAATPKRALQDGSGQSPAARFRTGPMAARAGRLADDFAPIDDHRASAAYRIETAKALSVKRSHEIASQTHD